MSTEGAALLAPLVHLNGSAPNDLIAALERAHRAVEAAREALAGTRPNARDYYPLGDAAMRQATAEHEARAEKLARVGDELVLIVDNVREQLDARARR